MSQELLLSTKAQTISIPSANGQQVSSDGEGESNIAFSSELGKQIDNQAQIPQQKDIKLETEAASTTQASTKPEIIVDESGNILPSEVEVVEQFIAQLLADFEGDPEVRQKLEAKITQFIENIVNDETPDLDLKQQLKGLIVELLDIGLNDKAAIAPIADKIRQQLSNLDEIKVRSTYTADPSVAKSDSSKQDTIENTIKAGAASKKADPAITNVVKQQSPTTDNEQQIKLADNTPKAGAASKETDPATINVVKQHSPTIANEQQVKIESKPVEKGQAQTQQVTEQSQKAQSLLQQISQTVSEQVNADDKPVSDKVARVAELVKQVIPQTNTASPVVISTSESTKPAAAQTASLRTDLLQALAPKQLNKDTNNKQTFIDLATTVTNQEKPVVATSDSRAERIAQLVALLKPAPATESVTPSTDKSTVTSFVTSSNTTQTTTPNASAAKALPVLDIQPTIQTNAWNRVLSSRVVWLASEGIQQASLKLNPANLGPVEVRLQVQNEQTNVTFIAQHPTTRDALEQALPRLRESFVENGLELAKADVSDQSSEQTNDQAESDDNNNNDIQDTVLANQTGQNSDQEVSGKEQELELGVNVYA